jgi:hypothetical protein
LFLFGGSIRILISNFKCKEECAKFLGIIVIMDLTKEHEQFGGEWYDFLTAIIIITSIILIKPVIFENI